MPALISSTTYKKFEKQNPNYYLSVFMTSTSSKDIKDVSLIYIGYDESGLKKHIHLLVVYADKDQRQPKARTTSSSSRHSTNKCVFPMSSMLTLRAPSYLLEQMSNVEASQASA